MRRSRSTCECYTEVENSHVVADYAGQKDVVIMNNNSRSWPTDDKDACWQLCMATSGCKSTTFGRSGKCYLKPVIATSANTQADSSRQYTVLKHCAYFTLPGIFFCKVTEVLLARLPNYACLAAGM